MGKKRRLSLSSKTFTGKLKALSCADSLSALRKFSIAAATILLAACGFAQSNIATPGQTERRIGSILSQMTIEEKGGLLGGVHDFDLRGVPRLNRPRCRLWDGPRRVPHYEP